MLKPLLLKISVILKHLQHFLALTRYTKLVSNTQRRKQYLKDSIKQKYCCQFRIIFRFSKYPCNYFKYNNGHKNRGCIKYKFISTDYRLTVDDTLDYFKLYYSKRTKSEHYNLRFKSLNLKSASVRNTISISNLNTLYHIWTLTVSIAAIVNIKKNKICSLNKLKEDI